MAGILRPGNAAPGAASDLVELVDLALAQLPAAATATQPVLVRSDSAGAQLRFSDHDGHRFQVFLTDKDDPDVACLELRHRQRAPGRGPHPPCQGHRLCATCRSTGGAATPSGCHARRTVLRLQRTWPWAIELAAAFAWLRALPLRY